MAFLSTIHSSFPLQSSASPLHLRRAFACIDDLSAACDVFFFKFDQVFEIGESINMRAIQPILPVYPKIHVPVQCAAMNRNSRFSCLLVRPSTSARLNPVFS
jgi:hypothetical protein